MRRGRLLLLFTTFVLALAVWVSRGALAVADAASWPRRMGILPSRWVPAVLLLVLLAALWRQRRPTLFVLLIPGVLLLPWLPVRAPSAALLWTGHAVVWVWILTALALAVVTWQRWSEGRVVAWLRDPRTGSFAAFGLACALYCAAAWVLYPVYAPGLAAVMLPALVAAGYQGVIVFLAFLSAFGTWMVWRAAHRVTGSAGAAWFGWASVALSAPFFFHAFMVSPDATGAAVVVAAICALVACERDERHGAGLAIAEWGSGRWLLLGGALGVLPWLHTPYVVVEAVLVACLALRLFWVRAFSRLAAFVALPVVSAAAWFGFFYIAHGEFGPAASNGYYAQLSIANIPRGLPALLFDQQFGVLPNAPVYALALLGLASLFRTRRRLAIEMTLVFASYVLLVSSSSTWWGGRSAPARLVVPVLLMLGVPAASFWSRQRAAGKAIALSALGVTVLITGSMTLFDRGSLIFSSRDGVALWMEWLTPVVDVPRALPNFVRAGTAIALAQTAIWVAFLALGAAVIRALARRAEGDREAGTAKLAVGTLLVFALVTMLAATATWRTAGAGGATPTTSTLALLHAYDPAARPVGVRFSRFGRASIDELPPALSLPVSNRRPVDAEGPLLMLFDVSPGVYRLSRASALAAQGSVVVTIGRTREPIARWVFDPSLRGGDYQFTLPVRVSSVVVSGDAAARRSMPRIALEPVSVAPEVWRFTVPPASGAAGYENLTAFAFQPDVYLEGPGIWVTGALPTWMVFSGVAGSPTVRLSIRNAPVENTITLRGQSRIDVLQMKPGEVRVVDLPVDAHNLGALVEITAERGYRPADVDKTTQDRRYLGVWIQGVPTAR